MEENQKDYHEGYNTVTEIPRDQHNQEFEMGTLEPYDEMKQYGSEAQKVVGTSFIKPFFGILLLTGVSGLFVIGIMSDARYLAVIGLVIAILIVISLIGSLLRTQRFSFWDALILRDLFEILFYLIAILVRLIIEIASDS